MGVLIGFPLISWMISLLLIDRSVFSWTGLEFFTVFWALITLWYALQIGILARVLRSTDWSWRDIGYALNGKRTLMMVLGYLVVASGMVGFVEYALANAEPDPQRLQALSDLADLTPTTTAQRVVFVALGLLAGLCEELVYRGFAIGALRSRGMNRWLAVLVAAVPFVLQHGLKAIEQAGWFGAWGVVFGVLFVATKRLYVNIAIHWLVILAAIPAILQALR